MLVVLVAVTAAVPRAGACQMGSGDPRQDLAKAFSESHEVFVARLDNYAERAQEARSPLLLATADFEVVEVLKGHPPMRGTLSGGVVWRAVPDMPIPPPPPPPSCGPWVTSPDIEGKTALIFVLLTVAQVSHKVCATFIRFRCDFPSTTSPIPKLP